MVCVVEREGTQLKNAVLYATTVKWSKVTLVTGVTGRPIFRPFTKQ